MLIVSSKVMWVGMSQPLVFNIDAAVTLPA
jgi:hypothetical protein